ncbi:PI-PLC X domain-containing protein 1, partial [Nephila pilipes]
QEKSILKERSAPPNLVFKFQQALRLSFIFISLLCLDNGYKRYLNQISHVKMLRIILIIIAITICINSSKVSSLINSLEDCYSHIPVRTEVFLTISSLYSFFKKNGVAQRWLEINWVVGKPIRGDIIHVYNKDPQQYPTEKPLLIVDPEKHSAGYFRTNIKVPIEASFLDPEQENPCMGYWASYRNKKGNIEASTCLQMHPFWMEQISTQISNLRIHEIMIPGSHDSGSFSKKKKSKPYIRYKYAQELSIFNQLVYGLRYFDLRIGYYKNIPGKYFINHNFLKTNHTVKSVLEQVKKFLMKGKKEIIILDFHDFPHGFTSYDIHQNLINLIHSILGPLLIPHDARNGTLKDIWESGKNVIVSYEYKFENGIPEYLWPRIPRAWGNKQSKETLRTYFQEVFSKPTPNGIWAAMAEMTPNAKMIVLHPFKGLRKMADEINREVTHWFRDLYWQKSNIVATDFFLGNDIINVAIRANQIKGVCPSNCWSYMKP